MNRKPTAGSVRSRRRKITLLWTAALAILVGALIYWEKTAILYILSTLGVTALLVIVALADLGESKHVTGESAQPQR
jgi:hypothetical protein